ncbi:MAG: glycosyltransferase family 4 protein, partial [Aeromicrobium sp.]
MREYLVVFGVALGVTYLLASVARMLAVRFNAVAKVRDRDVHAVPTPYFGGPAMLGGLVAAYLVATHLPFLSRADEAVFGDALAVIIGGAVICLVGVIDDLYELDALSKFAGQALAAVIVVAMGVKFVYLPLYGNYLGLDQIQAMIFSVLLIVGTANAVNFVDGLDGLAAGLVAIGAVAFLSSSFVLAVENGETRAIAASLLTAALAGACVGIGLGHRRGLVAASRWLDVHRRAHPGGEVLRPARASASRPRLARSVARRSAPGGAAGWCRRTRRRRVPDACEARASQGRRHRH